MRGGKTGGQGEEEEEGRSEETKHTLGRTNIRTFIVLYILS